MATLRHLTVHRLGHAQPGSEFALAPGVNLLLGASGTGKSTLLRWLAAVLAGDTRAWLGEAHHVSLELEAAGRRLEVDSVSRPREFDGVSETAADGLGADAAGPVWRLTLSLAAGEEGGRRVRVCAGSPAGVAERGEAAGGEGRARAEADEVVLSWPTPPHALSLAALLAAARAPLLAAAAADQGEAQAEALAEALAEVIGDLDDSFAGLGLHEPSLRWFGGALAGAGEAASALAPTPTSGAELRVAVGADGAVPRLKAHLLPAQLAHFASLSFLHHSELPPRELAWTAAQIGGFLAEFAALCGFGDAELRLALAGVDQQPSARVIVYRDLRFFARRGDGSILRHDALPEGQRRLLALLYYLALHPRFALLDEPGRGLAPAALRAGVAALGARQVVIACDDEAASLRAALASSDTRPGLVLCRPETEMETASATGREAEPATEADEAEPRGRWRWRNPSEGEVEALLRGAGRD
ncbi:hypothetical protein [Haliangium ochraceum]|uniref:Uncharacterized protein n=1 Tax=Haliangium ochraceum (strain DSM 14365 / JCM 11303 / SMP-2) TaxID=502025 RepID=D0LZE3_HALO1|nr:hypothetical protein [Haliangium ochraceum]ACY16405.1 hypothetical protein Hoch_3906 [Haliangium ochraceum DSM 14365]